VAGFILECLAGFVGIRSRRDRWRSSRGRSGRIQPLGRPALIEQKGRHASKFWRGSFRDSPHATMIDRSVAVDQDVAKPAISGATLKSLLKASPIISNCLSTAARTSALFE
jgi:hypothetical protein